MKNLFQIIQEAEQQGPPSQSQLDEWHEKVMQAKKTPPPKAISAIKAHLWNTGEYELFEFLENSQFWEVQNKDAPDWQRSAAVNVLNNRINFYYDKEFIERVGKSPSELVFLIAHEASHILRHHIDRTQKAKHDPSLANTAQDMIINDDIMKTKKIAGWDPKLITHGTFHGEKGKDADKVAVLQVPKKFISDYKKDGRKAYYYENMYNWLNSNNNSKDEDEGEAGEKDYFEEGSIVKVTKGDHKDEYRRITKVNKDGTYETEPVDIQKEIDKVKNS